MGIVARVVVVGAFSGLAGCASGVVYEGKYAQDEGWREGTVVEIAPARNINRPAFYDCRPGSLDRGDDTPYAAVAFLRNGRHYAQIMRLPADARLKVGDLVYVNFKNCDAPLPKRN